MSTDNLDPVSPAQDTTGKPAASPSSPNHAPLLTLPLIFVGLPGSGKSKVGRAVAARLSVAHVDTDDLILASDGRAISEIFAQDGEAAFRELEARAVQRALGMRAVISLGGGAVTTERVRDLLEGHSVIRIDVDHDELLRRTSKRSHRPLLLPDPDAALRRLRKEREHLYTQVQAATVASTAAPIDRVVDEVMALVSPTEASTVIEVGGPQPYPVVIGANLGSQAVAHAVRPDATRALAIHPPAVATIADHVISALQARGIEVHVLIHPEAEDAKTLDVVARGWEAAGDARLGRTDVVVGIGGGATTDVAGFIAATWLRGIDIVQVPTTLLGMVDAAVGGKTGINTAAGKNLVGSFHPPASVIEDLSSLASLPLEDLRAGLAEVIKCGFIADPSILALVNENPAEALDPASPILAQLVVRSVEVKARVVSADLREAGLREVLNYGHTLAHAIERAENYRWRHGDAVAVGCVFAAELANDLGLLSAQEVQNHRRALELVGLPVSYSGASLDELIEAMLSDKKVRSGALRFVLLDGLHNPVVRPVEVAQLRGPAERVGIRVGH